MTRPYDTTRWRKAAKRHLDIHPLCVNCAKQGQDKAATIVDHIIPWQTGKTEQERYDLFWSESNHQGLCASCHSGHKRMVENHGYSQACGIDGLPIDNKHPWSQK